MTALERLHKRLSDEFRPVIRPKAPTCVAVEYSHMALEYLPKLLGVVERGSDELAVVPCISRRG